MIQLRQATIEDIETITTHRIRMFVDMGEDPAEMETIREAYREWLRRNIASGDYLGMFAVQDGEVIAGGGMWLIHGYQPYAGSLEGERAMIFNMYTAPEHRGKGLARRIAEALLKIADDKAIKVVTLHASDAGRPLYEKLGFRQTNEMRRVK